MIEEWQRNKIVSLDGYSSTTKKEHIAKKFAAISELTGDDDQVPVLLEITMKNESGKHYFSLDSNCYSKYPSEQEILL